ncbi:diguanylate cyclase [Lysinibacillus sphaericus OT4b.31]|uniref:Diguanylate cyclase n=1 Tax=Lysinibacillus sphaericus OT4b.31 TaxID=1285586 RepID=R7ZBU7_LYSSH|nr:diguanylate cyclase [Lysinibacillus sphaericus OT4b.31]
MLEINASLVEFSVTDKLTGLKNRRFFQEKIEAHFALYDKNETIFSLLILDIDHFKRMNDTFGHQVGDEVLAQIAQILKMQARVGNIVARYGGEEFVLILPDTDIDESIAVAEQIRLAVEQAQWQIDGIIVSIGVATVTTEDTDVTILKRTDQALYASKENGRNRVTHCGDCI